MGIVAAGGLAVCYRWMILTFDLLRKPWEIFELVRHPAGYILN
jgi:hypothetical protein